ncbi:hypothetical protein NDU88_001999 [Pleurodeles waltl]|uniref:Uncharacterized protein n=1 Tax=Pleurodeles waltl TaxID=8319 RepID=A0AAV7T0Y6_PLEWA|nr:hypothetical protein NDU88_001999 [Pleurodeles waltl]
MTSPDHWGPLDSRFPTHRHRPQQTQPPLGIPAQLPPSGPMPLSPGQVKQRCVYHYRTQGNPPPQQQQGPGGSGSGHTVQGTEAQGNRGTGRAAVRQGGDRPREPTLQEALTTIMGAYHHSQETMATVMARFQEIQAQQEEQYMGFRDELRNIGSAMGTIVLALNQIVTTLRDQVAPQRAPVTSQDHEQPTTSAGASGQEAPTQRQATRTPPPAEYQPPRKRNLRSHKKTE